MAVTREPEVPVTREGAIGALKLLMIVLAATIFWEAAAATNAEFQAQGFLTAPSFLRGASKLLLGTETTAPFQERVWSYWVVNHRLVAMASMLLATVLLVARFLVLGRVLDYLYVESEARSKRVYAGFLASIFLVLVHAGAIYGMVQFARGTHASLVPLTLLLLFGLNLIWLAGVRLFAQPSEKRALRGVKLLAITSFAAGILLFAATWWAESGSVTDKAARGSELILLGCGVSLMLCLADACIQNHIYCKRQPAEPGVR